MTLELALILIHIKYCVRISNSFKSCMKTQLLKKKFRFINRMILNVNILECNFRLARTYILSEICITTFGKSYYSLYSTYFIPHWLLWIIIIVPVYTKYI